MTSHQLKTNIIYCGDNLQMLKDVPDETIDLIYIDPPFNSNRNYETFWGDIQEKRAFEDRFGDAQAYIDYMRPRILELYRVLKKTGSFYYHCDWHASHYVKMMLDQIFDFNNFQNEIVWCYKTRHFSKTHFGRKHDTIFFYSKSNVYTFNWKEVLRPLSDSTIAKFKLKDEKGLYRLVGRGIKGSPIKSAKDVDAEWEKTNPELVTRSYLKEGVPVEDYWLIEIINQASKERLGYPTQKPLELLERIIQASSNKGDVILDAFCGCGTTLVAAQKLGRKWIGIDISPTACRVMAQRLWDIFKLKEGTDFIVNDLPKTEEELRNLPPFEFQNWTVIALGGIPNRIKVGDYGIDGKLYPIEQERIKEEGENLFGNIDIYYPIQVKQKDKAGRPDIDNFETAMRRDKRNKGYFISFDFSDDAIKEIKRLDKEGEIQIIPITVKDLLKNY
jgi:DNA modification methylase